MIMMLEDGNRNGEVRLGGQVMSSSSRETRRVTPLVSAPLIGESLIPRAGAHTHTHTHTHIHTHTHTHKREKAVLLSR